MRAKANMEVEINQKIRRPMVKTPCFFAQLRLKGFGLAVMRFRITNCPNTATTNV